MTVALQKLNFRDVGGLRTTDGRMLRTGLVYRSEGPASFGENHRRELQELGVRLVCDLRAAVERDAAPNDWCGPDCRLLHLDMNTDLRAVQNSAWAALRDDPTEQGARKAMMANYAAMPEAFLPYLRGVVEAVAEGETPLLIHCTAGKDRTGFAVAALLLTAGVSRADAIADYLRSDVFAQNKRLDVSIDDAFLKTFGFKPDQATMDALIGVHESYIERSLDVVDQNWGSLDGYLEAARVGGALIARYRDALVARS